MIRKYKIQEKADGTWVLRRKKYLMWWTYYYHDQHGFSEWGGYMSLGKDFNSREQAISRMIKIIRAPDDSYRNKRAHKLWGMTIIRTIEVKVNEKQKSWKFADLDAQVAACNATPVHPGGEKTGAQL